MSRYRAAGTHLIISILVAALVLTAMLTVWYPGAYFKLMGGATLLFIMFGVDVCLGPLATLFVFKSGKKGMKFDLVVIALLQISAMAYGIYVTSVARPAYTVFVGNGFRIAAANELEEAEKAAQPRWREAPMFGPELVASNPPQGGDAKFDMILIKVFGGDRHMYPKMYAPYEEKRDEILKAAKPLSELRAITKANEEKVSAFVKDSGRPETDFVFLPIKGRASSDPEAEKTGGRIAMAAILDTKTAQLIKILDVPPEAAQS